MVSWKEWRGSLIRRCVGLQSGELVGSCLTPAPQVRGKDFKRRRIRRIRRRYFIFLID